VGIPVSSARAMVARANGREVGIPRSSERAMVAVYGCDVSGAVIFVVVMLLVVPVAVMLAGALWSAVFGWLSFEDAARRAGEIPE
jgi:hypothetical protein